ncbi:hypothetical protein ABIC09_004970 [Bradyrhizobium sp. S3.12.5]|uniref:hypothetical protein n=1 Tax=Bradyrhizobium sp. S3.12.5 TaxID=3156386 RepID=UPI0033977650
MTKSSPPCTTIIHRPHGDLSGYRLVCDRASRVVVHAFPMSALAAVSASGLLAAPGTYIMTDGRVAYVGESARVSRRLADHSTDPSKIFARDAFVVGGCDGSMFDKSLALDFQFRLTRQAVDCGAVTVAKGLNPVQPQMTAADASTHDRIYADALRLLQDAGCRIFQSVDGQPVGPQEQSPPGQNCPDADDNGPMTVGVTTTPLGAGEFELRYLGLWARGYWAGDRFIVAALSEVRSQTNGSVDAITRARREELFSAGVLSEIPGVADRRRLTVAVAFPSTSIAAKTVCGAHTPGKWTPVSPRAVWLAP